MEDYKEVIKELLLLYFKPTGNADRVQFCSTIYVLKMLRGVIPTTPIDEHDVFEVLEELKFNKELHHFYEIDKKTGKETDKISHSSFMWRMYFV